jgi:hypothetical protein
MVLTFGGVNNGVRIEINANVGMIEHSSRACYPISAERNLCNVFHLSTLLIKIVLKYRMFQKAQNPKVNKMFNKHIAL